MASDEGAEDHNACAHLFNEFVGSFGARFAGKGQDADGARSGLDIAAEEAQQGAQGVHVFEGRDIAQQAFAIGKQGCAKNGQRGIFGAANGDTPAKRSSSPNTNCIHDACARTPCRRSSEEENWRDGAKSERGRKIEGARGHKKRRGLQSHEGNTKQRA